MHPHQQVKRNGQDLLCGHEMKLKYWNKSTQQFEDKFPAGVTLGWCLEGMGFNNGNKTGHTHFLTVL